MTKFNGSDYIPELDDKRLNNQLDNIRHLMLDGKYRTLREIHTKFPWISENSISAQLRHLRKERFGSYIINRRRTGNPENGLFEYNLEVRNEI